MTAAPPAELDLTRLLGVYRAETAENLATMEQALLELEARGAPDAELIGAVLRAAHTLKGNSASMGDEAVTAAAHALEDDAQGLRDGLIPFSAALLSGLLDAVDGLRGLVGRGAGTPEHGETRRASSLRVDTGRLDALLDLTGEITIARGKLAHSCGAGVPDDVAIALGQLEFLHTALNEQVMGLRMVPLAPVFEALRRTVRDAAGRLERRVTLVIGARDVEVDTRIAEQMRDPLTHMIRNAVDHGIEPPAERQRAGKPVAGTIALRASHRAGAVVIELEDDGRGLDRARIAARAEVLGLVRDSATLTDAQVFALIFEPGFSTADRVTEVSGRGVGMDVVRRQVHALRGTVEIDSRPGHGTRFTIRLPLTIALISGFVVHAGGERYVLPLETVEECVELHETRGQREGVFDLRGAPVPWLRLRDLLGQATPGASDRAHVVVVRDGARRIGLVVDALDGDCQSVIKPLDAGLDRLPGIAGSTILSDGRVAFILDVPALIARRELS